MNLEDEINIRKKEGLFRQRKVVSGAQGSSINIGSENYLNFSSNDYLGFANNTALKNIFMGAIERYGIGAASSQLLVGHFTPHKELENKLSEFLNREASLIFPSGYQANLAVASVLIDANTVVLQDKLNHASLVDAAMLSRGKLVRYRHNDIEHLKSLLEKYKYQQLLLMTDGLFSMDGDYAKLDEIVELCKRYNVFLVVDDAHGLGVLGETGAGLLEQYNLSQDDVPLLIGTFGKSFAANGAFVSGSKLHIEAFIQKARTYIYTTALMPAIAQTLIHAIDMVINGEHLRKHLRELIEKYKLVLSEGGIIKSNSLSQIQPLIIGETDKTLMISNVLYEKKIMVSAVRPPTVPKKTSRLRVSVTAAHTKDQVMQLAKVVNEAMAIHA